MLNLTIVFLARSAFLSSSALVTLSRSSVSRNLRFDKLSFSHFANPVLFTRSDNFNMLLRGSIFTSGASQVVTQNSIENEEFTSHQNFNDKFTLSIRSCTFSKIAHSTNPGAAFCALSQIHTLDIEGCRFLECYNSAEKQISRLNFPVSGGAFVFIGSKSEVSACCFVRNNAYGNIKTFEAHVNPNGFNCLRYSFFLENGDEQSPGHSLFGVDHGRCEIMATNITLNKAKEGYAAGSIGSFAAQAIVAYVCFANNSGNSVFGIASTAIGDLMKISFSSFTKNTATKYGVYMRLSYTTTFESVSFIKNNGIPFYGAAPLRFVRCHCDCGKPLGIVDDISSFWNNAVLRSPIIKVPDQCSITVKTRKPIATVRAIP